MHGTKLRFNKVTPQPVDDDTYDVNYANFYPNMPWNCQIIFDNDYQCTYMYMAYNW